MDKRFIVVYINDNGRWVVADTVATVAFVSSLAAVTYAGSIPRNQRPQVVAVPDVSSVSNTETRRADNAD